MGTDQKDPAGASSSLRGLIEKHARVAVLQLQQQDASYQPTPDERNALVNMRHILQRFAEALEGHAAPPLDVTAKLTALAEQAEKRRREFQYGTDMEAYYQGYRDALIHRIQKGDLLAAHPAPEPETPQELKNATPTLGEAFNELELAVYGKRGNTFERSHIERISTVLLRCYNAGRKAEQVRVQALEEALDSWKRLYRGQFQRTADLQAALHALAQQMRAYRSLTGRAGEETDVDAQVQEWASALEALVRPQP